MKRGILIIIIVALGVFTAYRLLSKKEIKPEEKRQGPLTVSKNSDAFNNSFGRLLNDYYSLRDALVDWDTVKVNESAKLVEQHADGLALNELKADSSIILTAQNYASSISGEAKGLIGETAIEQKRKAFDMLTSEMYDLVRIVKYDREILYHIKCPMAFNDSVEAWWLSNSSKIINPYLGKKHPTYKNKMLGCGEVVDSLNFARK
jgi:hypothetical protein